MNQTTFATLSFDAKKRKSCREIFFGPDGRVAPDLVQFVAIKPKESVN
jgi:hypothetical protein